MTDIASLSLEVKSDQVEQATVALKGLVPAASAAERAAQKWGMTSSAAARSTDDFSKRVNNTIKSLEFERQQLTRSAAERANAIALRRAGVAAASDEGRAILAQTALLQREQEAVANAARGHALMTSGIAKLVAVLGVAALAYRAWAAGMKAADLGEQAEQVNLTTDQLQAYRFVAIQNGVEVEKLDQGMIRFTATMGAAMRGGEEQIRIFERLGVKLLDARGELRQTGDVLPEFARGLLKVNSETERNALLTEVFGRSGARMVTLLREWAKGNDALIDSAKAQGAILDAEVIAKWDHLKDSLARAGAAADVTFAKLGAPIATWALEKVANLLDFIVRRVQFLDLGDQVKAAAGAAQDIANIQKRMQENQARIEAHPGAHGIDKLKAENLKLAERLAAAQAVSISASAKAAGINEQLKGRTFNPADPDNIGLNLSKNAPPGVSSPVPKGQAEAWQKLLDFGRDYIEKKKAETAALGLNAEAASRLTHEQELLAKATDAGKTVSAAQAAQIKELAQRMAEADATFKSAKFMDDFNRKSEEFIANQEIERATLYMGTEAAMAYRLEQEAINKAKTEGIILTPEYIGQIQQLASAQAAAAEKTRTAKEWVDFEKEAFRGFFTDVNQGLREGQTVWDSFGNAAMNVLNKISDKLMAMAADKLFEAAFGGSGGIGGLFSGIFSGLFGSSGPGAAGGAASSIISGGIVAKGGVFNHGNVVPFARGGVVTQPTLFPMANGMGLMGEAGPEGVLPLSRGPGGRLGVKAYGGGGQQMAPVIRIEIAADSGWVRATARDESGKVVAQSSPKIVGEAVKQSGKQVVGIVEQNHLQRGGEYR